MTAAETRAFIKRLARFVFEHHARLDDSPQRGMVYEYWHAERKGQPDQFVQGEALDTMHDGAWLAAAMVNAYRATGDPDYRRWLVDYQLPFYLKMLNHSDTLFSAKRNDAGPEAHTFNREHALQEGERGFVPYWWDNGGSVSLERTRTKNPLPVFASVDFLVGKPNPLFKLNGYSLGSSNHMAQDLAVMLELAWLLLHDESDDASRKLLAEVAEAARNLHACRLRHFGHIPMTDAALALASGDAKLFKLYRGGDDPALWAPANAYTRALYKPGERIATPGFADDQEYNYYHGIARAGGKLPEPLAFRTIYDAFTLPQLYAYYSDDAPVPPGINRFDLHPIYFQDGKPQDYRSDRKGPSKGPRPIGSRMGPQNMIVCGWALQALRAYPGIWEKPYADKYSGGLRVFFLGSEFSLYDDRYRGKSIELAGVTLHLASNRHGLRVFGPRPKHAIELKVYGRPDGAGPHAKITLSADGRLAAVNDAGQPLLIIDNTAPPEKGSPLNDIGGNAVPANEAPRFDLEVPFTVIKGQAPWANGVEHGRCSIAVGDERRNFYLASSEYEVREWLEHELAGGLRTWQAIFDEYGYIPTGIGAGSVLPGINWDRFSDSGGYAHLISAASQWLLYLENKSDWQTHHIPQLK